MLYSLTYVSSARRLLSRAELTDLLLQSRSNNTRAEISGMLLYKDGNFLQVLEGEREAVINLYTRIELDPRHSGSITLLSSPLVEREFADWSMGFRDLSRTDKESPVEGYSDFMNVPLEPAEFVASPGRARKLLRLFQTR